MRWSLPPHAMLWGTLLVCSCREAPEVPDGRATDAEAARPPAPLAEFLAAAERIEDSENEYLGRRQVARLTTELSREDLGHGESVNLMLQLCWHHLRLGNNRDALATVDGAFEKVAGAGGSPSPSMHKLRALVHLRDAETRNCIERHNRDCCLFPLEQGGVHSEQEPIQRARDALLDLLATSPQDLEAAWLLNIAGLALGDWPASVPEHYRLPKSAFTSDLAMERFVDIAPELGVATFNLAGGAIFEDFNGDGRLDIVTSTYDPRGPLMFYRQRSDGSFADDSISSGLSQQLGGLNCIAADYNNDGAPDILVLRGAWLGDTGQIRNSLLRNNGDGTFSDVTHAAGLAEPARPTQVGVWGDFDNDGDLDLFVGNESRAGLGEGGGGDFPSQLFRNEGNGTFTDVAAGAGVTNDRYCKGAAAGDYDNDGDLDIYVSNRGPNRLYRNNGDMTFTDVAADAMVSGPERNSFATWFFDYDNDGHLDLFVAAYQSSNADVAADLMDLPHGGEPPRLYRNLGDGTFADVAADVGLDHAWLPMGANFGDLDNDGFLDIYLTTGRPDFASITPNVMLRNDSGRTFQDVTVAGGFGHLQKGHGVAFGDFDNDGDQDIYHQLGGFFSADKFHNALFQNPGQDGRFLVVNLVGTESNRQGTGARIRVTVENPDGEGVFHRAAGAVSSFGGSPARQEIGLGRASSIRTVEVSWPVSGTLQRLVNVPLDSFIQVTEGSPDYRVVRRGTEEESPNHDH